MLIDSVPFNLSGSSFKLGQSGERLLDICFQYSSCFLRSSQVPSVNERVYTACCQDLRMMRRKIDVSNCSIVSVEGIFYGSLESALHH